MNAECVLCHGEGVVEARSREWPCPNCETERELGPEPDVETENP